MDILQNFLQWLNDNILWGIPMLILLLGAHIYFTCKLGIQKYMFLGIKETFKTDANGGDVSPWGALSISLAANIGTGNIVGVATAIGLGGPGALFWCIVTGILGIATKYAESVVAIKYRVKSEYGMMGGAMTALEYGLKCKWLGVLFAIFCILATLITGSAIQANSIATLVNDVTDGMFPLWLLGIILSLFVFLVIIGSVKSISNVCTWLVPIMAVAYIVSCFVILVSNYTNIPNTLTVIVKEAFSFRAIAGGVCGCVILTAMRYGVSRGLFANESGMGSTPIVAAASKTPNSCKQALINSTSNFWVTICCLLSGLVIINSGAHLQGLEGAAITNYAFGKLHSIYGINIGSWILVFSLFFFAFSTMIGWFYYAETCMRYLFKNKGILTFKIIYIIFLFIGAILNLNLVWKLGDTFNALMIIPNVICIILLRKVIFDETKKFVYSDKLNEIDESIN